MLASRDEDRSYVLDKWNIDLMMQEAIVVLVEDVFVYCIIK